MFHFPHRIRFVRAAALLVALAAALAPAAQAADKSDAVDRYLRNNAATLAAPVASAADRAPRAMPTDYAKAGLRTKQYGIPRAMPSHYGNALGQQAGAPRAMPSDYAAAVDRALVNVLPGDASVPFWPHETGALAGTSETYAGMRADGSYIDPSLGRRVANNGTGTQVDFRAADTRDAAIGRYPDAGPVLVSVPGSFEWGDAIFGAGATGAALLLAGVIAIAVRQRKRIVLS